MRASTRRTLALASTVVMLISLVLVPGTAAGPTTNWPQWGQNPQHFGAVDVAGQALDGQLADLVYDPFVPQEQADTGGDLLAHYQVPLIHDSDVFMVFKAGTYTPDNGINTATHWNSQIWGEKRWHWEGSPAQLVEKWSFVSDWKPEPADLVGGWEPVFHAVLTNDAIYVPGAGGTVFKLDSGDGSLLARIHPFGATIDPNTYVAGVLSADASGNVYYNALKLNADESAADSWLVKVGGDGTTRTVRFTTLVPGAPTTCSQAFGVSSLPWPPSPTAQPSQGACGPQRPGINVAPAIAPDGTIYTVSRADFNSRYGYLVAVNPDLSPKWAASLRDHLSDGCGVLIPIAPSTTPEKGKCRYGANVGVDPQTNQAPAGRVIDQSSSSPTVLPDGSVLYGAYSRYNVSRGHLFKFSAGGQFLAAYDFGWDSTPAVYQHDGSYSIVIKDNHYDEEEGFYCNQSAAVPVSQIVCAFTGVPAGPFYITQLSPTLAPEWKFQSTNTQSCSRNADGTLSCVSDHPNGFEWCINAPAIDSAGVVYVNSEDGNLYSLPQGHTGVFTTPQQRFFTNLALGAAYTPLSIGADGLIYTENDGHLFVVGMGGRPVGHGSSHGGGRHGDRLTDTDRTDP